MTSSASTVRRTRGRCSTYVGLKPTRAPSLGARTPTPTSTRTKVIFLHVKAERDYKGEDIIRKADDAVIKACAVFLKESRPEDKTDDEADCALDLSKECNMLE